MTTEEKARAYDEALSRASKLRVQNPFDTVSQMMEHVFPELAESDDERIRKWLICGMNALKDQKNETFATIPIDDCIAWLEKQGEQKPKWKQSDNIMFSQLYDFLVNKTPRLQVDCNEYAAWLNSLKQRMQ